MPLLPIPKLPFPRVPELPGVPLLLRAASRRVLSEELRALADNPGWFVMPGSPQWGVFTLAGDPLVEVDSVLDVGFSQNHKISNYPIQNNAFNSYNKVAEPFQATVRLMKSGSFRSGNVEQSMSGNVESQASRERGDFLDAIDQAAKSLDLYIVVTPERSYINCNITSYSYKREQSKGAYQIVVDLTLQEVRQVQAAYTSSDSRQKITNAKDVGATSNINAGKVQAQPFAVPRPVFSV